MGLSNEERYSNMVWAIKDLTEWGGELKSSYGELEEIKKHLGDLWPAFLGHKSNKSRWLFGGNWDSDKFGGSSLMLEAFESVRDDIEIAEERKNKKDSEESVLDEVNKQDYYDLQWLTDHKTYQVIQISERIEDLLYGLFRYSDEFARQYEELARILRIIQGEIFKLMSAGDSYYRAYLNYQIIKKCRDRWSKDFITTISDKQAWHHDLKLRQGYEGRDIETKDLQDTFESLQGQWTRKIPIQMRLSILLTLMGRRYHYDHRHKALIKAIVEHNSTSEDKVDLEKIQEILHWCKEEKVKYDKESRERKEHCYLTDKSWVVKYD